LNNCSVHIYHNHCQQRCQSKCWNLGLSSSQNQKKCQHTESMMKILNENQFIENNENTVDDDPGNVESATDDSNNGNFIRTWKKIFWIVNFVFIK